MLRDLDRGLSAAVGVTVATAPAARVAEPRKADRDAQQLTLKEGHIDRASVSSPQVRERTPALESDCTAWPVQQRPYFSNTAFHLDWERQVSRCPQDVEMTFEPGGVVHLPVASGARCPWRTPGPRRARGRRVSITAEEQVLSELRARLQTREGRAKWRERVGVAHGLSHVGHWQGDRARYCGTRKNLLDLRPCAVVPNLHHFARQPEMMMAKAV